jgi:hypothetical protein
MRQFIGANELRVAMILRPFRFLLGGTDDLSSIIG